MLRNIGVSMRDILQFIGKFLAVFGAFGVLLSMAITFFFWWILAPWLAIWALNTLFGFTIVFGLKTWFAAFVLLSFIRPAAEITVTRS